MEQVFQNKFADLLQIYKTLRLYTKQRISFLLTEKNKHFNKGFIFHNLSVTYKFIWLTAVDG